MKHNPFRKEKLPIYGAILVAHLAVMAVAWFTFPPLNWGMLVSLIAQAIFASTKRGERFLRVEGKTNK